MKWFKRTQLAQPPSRHVASGGRTSAYAYYARRSAEPSVTGRQLLATALDVRKAKRAAAYWRQRFGLLLIIIAVLVGIGNILGLASDPIIQPVSSTQVAFLHSASVYQQAAKQLLDSSFLNRNKITIDTGAVSSGLEHQFPELSSVTVTLPLFGRNPTIYVTQADPALLLTAANGQTYIIDTQGRAIASGDVARPSLQLIPVRDASGAAVQLGQLVLPSTAVKFIQAMHFQLAQRQVHIDSLALPAASSELDIYLKGQRYYVKCNLASGSVLQQAGAFLAAQQYFEGRGIVPGRYVDVRVDGRVYYQ